MRFGRLTERRWRMVSIKTIAEECGVSIATVSKALNNHNDVSAATKKLVCETAKKLGYLPNAQARALKTNKTYNIGVLLNDVAQSGLTHVFFSAVLDSFRVEAEKMGYDITIICGQIGGSRMSYYEHCVYRRVDGVLAACVDFYSNEVRNLMESEIPVVSIDFSDNGSYSVMSDNATGIKQIVEYAYSCGHKKIAYIYGDSSQVTTIRLNSYLDTMKSLGLTVQPDYIKQGKYLGMEITEELAESMLNIYDPPTCIIAADDLSAIGAIKAVNKRGKKVPDDISVIGYDGIKMTQMMTPSLTTYCQNPAKIGEMAAKLLIKVIQKADILPSEKNVIVGGHLISGNTVKHI